MRTVNHVRVFLSALAGGVAWFVWSSLVNLIGIGGRYAESQASGAFLEEPRYPFFAGMWILMLFLLSYVIAWLYAGLRASYGPGFFTALALGVLVGFVAGFPMNFVLATWFPISRMFPLWWMLELWLGSVIASLVVGWLYRD
ncbi:MAG: hypothetical protein EHM18_03415 [Acidobacteria bacterium]|nr:MAG: hypothetical protein EHM18_03415 [Acidobacteriota bacterium]